MLESLAKLSNILARMRLLFVTSLYRLYDTGGAEGAIASPLFRQAIFFAQNTQRREIKKVPNLYECQAKHMFLRRHTRVPPLILHFCCKICVMTY